MEHHLARSLVAFTGNHLSSTLAPLLHCSHKGSYDMKPETL